MSALSFSDTNTNLTADVRIVVLRGSRRRCANCGRRRVVFATGVQVVDEAGNSLHDGPVNPWRCRPCSNL